jgi:DNA-binding transcriptional MerR regulator
MDGFTRQEAIALSKATSSRLAYLDRINLVVPKKYGNTKKPTVVYTWEQVLELRAINDLREQVSLQTIRKMLDFFAKEGYDPKLRDKHLVALNDDIHWIMPDWSDMPKIMQVASRKDKGLGQLVLVVLPARGSLIMAVWDTANKSNVVDFESFKERAKESPKQAA